MKTIQLITVGLLTLAANATNIPIASCGPKDVVSGFSISQCKKYPCDVHSGEVLELAIEFQPKAGFQNATFQMEEYMTKDDVFTTQEHPCGRDFVCPVKANEKKTLYFPYTVPYHSVNGSNQFRARLFGGNAGVDGPELFCMAFRLQVV